MTFDSLFGFVLPEESPIVEGNFMSNPSGSSMDVRKRTWPVCPWADPIGTRGDFSEAALVPALTAGMANVSTTPAWKELLFNQVGPIHVSTMGPSQQH